MERNTHRQRGRDAAIPMSAHPGYSAESPKTERGSVARKKLDRGLRAAQRLAQHDLRGFSPRPRVRYLSQLLLTVRIMPTGEKRRMPPWSPIEVKSLVIEGKDEEDGTQKPRRTIPRRESEIGYGPPV
jgi:hypothetical protein